MDIEKTRYEIPADGGLTIQELLGEWEKYDFKFQGERDLNGRKVFDVEAKLKPGEKSSIGVIKIAFDAENYLPLDGMLTQAGDLFLMVHNHSGDSELKLTIPNGTEHSPYWVHLRDWKPKPVTVQAGNANVIIR